MNKIQIPEMCPFCGTKTEMQDSRLLCPNKACKETNAHRLVSFLDGLKILGLGIESARALIASKEIKSIQDLIKISGDSLGKILGKNGEKLALDIENAIKLRKISDIDLLVSLTVPNVSRHTAELILFKYRLEELYNPFGQLSVDLTSIDGIGEITQTSVAKYFQENEQEIRNLILLINPIHNTIAINENSPIKGMSIVETGSGEINGRKISRPEFSDLLTSNGASLKSSVSKKTDYVVVGAEPGKAKIDKANELGIKVILFEDFIKLIGE